MLSQVARNRSDTDGSSTSHQKHLGDSEVHSKIPSLLTPPICAHTYLHLPLRGQLDNGGSIHLPEQHTARPWGGGNSFATLHKTEAGFHGI